MNEQVLTRGIQHVLEGKPENTCVMLDENGQEVKIGYITSESGKNIIWKIELNK